MRPIQERLAVLAADLREDSRKAGLAAAEAKPEVEQAEAVLTALHKEEDDLKARLAEMERRLAETQHRIAQAAADHRQAAAVLAQHERDGQDAADAAEKLDRLARDHKAPDPPPAAEALAAVGLMPAGPKAVEATPRTGVRYQDNGLPMVWSTLDPPGGYVCAMPATPDQPSIELPDGSRVCGNPVESEPCSEHGQPAAEPARNTGPIPVIAPPTPGDPDTVVATGPPDMTMPDVGLNPRRLPPAHSTDEPRHAAPRENKSRVTGAIKALIGREHDDQDGDGDE